MVLCRNEGQGLRVYMCLVQTGLFWPMVAWPWNCGTQGNRADCVQFCAQLISSSQLICSHYVEFANSQSGKHGFCLIPWFHLQICVTLTLSKPQCISFCLLQPLEVHVVERLKVTTLSYNHNDKEACWQLTLFLGRVRPCFSAASELEPATRLWGTRHGNFLRVHSTEARKAGGKSPQTFCSVSHLWTLLLIHICRLFSLHCLPCWLLRKYLNLYNVS